MPEESSGNAVPTPTQPSAPDHRDVMDKLRALLGKPEVKNEEWQTLAGRNSALLGVAFPNVVDDTEALQIVGLIGLAQDRGVKQARKSTIKLTRWATTAPPVLSAIATDDERRAAQRLICKVKASWTRPYIAQQLLSDSLPKDLHSSMLKWASKAWPDLPSLFAEVIEPLVVSTPPGKQLASLFKEASQLLAPKQRPSPGDLSRCLSSLVHGVLASQENAATEPKAHVKSMTTFAGLLKSFAYANPALLAEPAFISAMKDLRQQAANQANAKVVLALLEVLEQSTASMIVSKAAVDAPESWAYWGRLRQILEEAYPGWDKKWNSLSTTGQLKIITDALQSEPTSSSDAAYDAQAVYARLLPAMDAFVSELSDPSSAESLRAMIHEAAATASVSPIGRTGEIIEYDPLTQQVFNSQSVRQHVRVVRPGVQVVRSDGSIRVLVSALVAPAQ